MSSNCSAAGSGYCCALSGYSSFTTLRNKLPIEMTRIKLIVFDLDGTLVNAYTPVYRSLNYVLKQCGLKPVGHSTVKSSVGWGDRNLLGKFIPPAQIEKALKIFRQHHKKALKSGV